MSDMTPCPLLRAGGVASKTPRLGSVERPPNARVRGYCSWEALVFVFETLHTARIAVLNM